MPSLVSKSAMLVLLNLCIWWFVLSVVIVACLDTYARVNVCTIHLLLFCLLDLLIQCLVASLFPCWCFYALLSRAFLLHHVVSCVYISILQLQVVWYYPTTFGVRVVWKGGVHFLHLKLVWFSQWIWWGCFCWILRIATIRLCLNKNKSLILSKAN